MASILTVFFPCILILISLASEQMQRSKLQSNLILQQPKQQKGKAVDVDNKIELLILLLNIQGMKRPQSAKIGMRGYWGQSHTDEASQHNVSSKNLSKKQVVLMKPDLTSHDFSRILPKKIHQDKERLYSQTLQLKQSVNELTEENMRLKTKISILEKEKTRMGKFLQSAQEVPSKKSQSRLNLYASKISDKQNNIVQNLKKLVRDTKEEVQYLKSENIKIKKTMKYTKVNQMEIEKKILYDQNKRIGRMLEDLTQHINDQAQLQRENNQLKKYLEEEMEENKTIAEENQKYEEIVEELQNKIRSEVEKYQTKEKKLQRDYALQKRKNQQCQKYIEDLRRELNNIKNAQQSEKPKPVKNVIRPSSSNPNKRQITNQAMNRQATTKAITKKEETIANEDIASKSQTEEIKAKNSQLEQQLREIKSKLERSEFQLKQRGNNKQKQSLLKSLVQKDKQSPKKQSNPHKQQQKQQMVKVPTQPKIQEHANPNLLLQSPKKQEQSYNQQGFDKDQESYNYEQQFQKVDEGRESRLQEQIQKVKQDFEENQEQEEIYKKQDSKKGKNAHKKKKKEVETNSNKKQGAFKPNKKILAEIKQLLTYRMKSQRYPFSDLRGDIESAQSSSFSYSDLCQMFINEPFYLTPAYAKVLLSYCYESQAIGQNDLLKSEVLVGKLRKVIQDFQLMDEEEEKEMIIRISQMTCTYPQQLEAAFEDIKNGEETVPRAKLIEMFQKLELESKYIQLIIAELSLCSDDLQHLNFHGFFERFYVEEEDPHTDMQHPIEEQGEESEQSYRETNKRKKSSKANVKKISQEEEEDYQMGRYMMAVDNRVNQKAKRFDDEDIVSDDGRI